MTHLWPAQGGRIDYISSPPSPAWTKSAPRVLALLGSTGSIGVSAIKVVEARPKMFRVAALAGGRNMRLLAEQSARLRPAYLGVLDGAAADALRELLPAGYRPEIVTGQDGYIHLATLEDATTVLSAQVGAAGLRATVAAALAGKVICLANKESLVLAGGLIRAICAATGAAILPVDSEHNAIFQALAGHPATHVRRVILTASGGPFHGMGKERLTCVTREQALRHPNWSMGAKITVDSATLMNKGLEVMEAFHLYGAAEDDIDVVIHPQSLVHSLVEFTDGSLMAHLGSPDMCMAIAHCLAWPRRLDAAHTGVAPLNLVKEGALTFAAPDIDSFPCLALAQRALREGGGMPVALNAANEAAVDLFLDGRIGFMDIPALLARAMDEHAAATPGDDLLRAPLDGAAGAHPMLEAVMALDAETRRQVHAWVGMENSH